MFIVSKPSFVHTNRLKTLRMQKMPSCCIPGCNSYRESTKKNIAYFRFPLHNVSLLAEWLREINWPDWMPSDTSQICSAHFKEKDVDWHLNEKYVRLLPTAVPVIFSIRRKMARKRETRNRNKESEIAALESNAEGISSVQINDCKPHRNKVTLLKRKPVIVTPGVMIPVDMAGVGGMVCDVNPKLRKILTKGDVDGSVKGEICPGASNGQKPILKIIINKQYDTTRSSTPVPFETIYLPDHRNEEEVPAVVEVQNEVWTSLTDPKSSNSNLRRIEKNLNNVSANDDHSSYVKSLLTNAQNKRPKLRVRQYSNNKLKQIDIPILPTSVQSDSRVASQVHVYNHPFAVNVEYCSLKSRQESEQLRKRLKELKERRKREQLKIVRLQMHLTELEKQIEDSNRKEIVLPNLREGCESPGTSTSWLLREKEEYENLLKDVREIKLKVLRQRHMHELEKIRSLQLQMTNLVNKMKENDRKEIAALSNLRQTTSSTVYGSDWMEREKQEYEKLLRDVKKIKQNYKLRQSKQSCEKSDASKSVLQSEKVLNDEECILIETMQNRNRSIKEIKDDNNLKHKIERGIDMMDNSEKYCDLITEMNDDCGEIIGLIDEDSIDIDMSREGPILTLNDELPDPGLLDT